MSSALPFPLSIRDASLTLGAAYALWILLAGTAKMPSWILRQ
jgi:hypothetical protein